MFILKKQPRTAKAQRRQETTKTLRLSALAVKLLAKFIFKRRQGRLHIVGIVSELFFTLLRQFRSRFIAIAFHR